jgi:uncharacterized protein YndB with AHSA1/START domain
MALRTLTTTTADPARVWAVLSDLDAWPEWLPTVDTLTREEPGRPHGVGAAYLLKQPRLPRARWVVSRWEPGKGFTWTSSGPGVTTTGTHDLTPTPDGGTEIVLGIRWTGLLGGLFGLIFGRLTRRYIDTEAASLAERAVGG